MVGEVLRARLGLAAVGDLRLQAPVRRLQLLGALRDRHFERVARGGERVQIGLLRLARDRKSTRLNSSHLGISYAVFCLTTKNSAVIRSTAPPTHPISPLPLHDALPIYGRRGAARATRPGGGRRSPPPGAGSSTAAPRCAPRPPLRARRARRRARSDRPSATRARSEEHTSELQSLRHLVCRLLLDNKKLSGHSLHSTSYPPDLPPSPTRRSSDLWSARCCARDSAWRRSEISASRRRFVDCSSSVRSATATSSASREAASAFRSAFCDSREIGRAHV